MEAKTTEWRPGPTVCRCCLAEGCYKDISTEYFWMGKREVYAEMLLETFDLNISYSQSGGPNSNSRLICEPCISRLRDAADFKRQVTECERSFTQYLDPVATDVDVDLGLEKEVKIERVKDEKSMSDDEFVAPEFVDDDDDDDDLDDQPLTKLASKIPKKESVDVLDLLDNAKVTEKRKSSSKTKSSPAKKSKLKKEVASSSKVKPEPRKKKANNDPERRNAELIIKYTTSLPFRININTILCVYCGETFEDPNLFRSHMEQEHTSFHLDLTFRHLTKAEFVKVDISTIHCRICARAFESLELVAAHLKLDHRIALHMESKIGVIPFELKGDKEWICCVCSKNVPSLLLLSKHTVSHFQNFVCDLCGKSYISATGLLKHVKSKHHDEYKVHCRRCRTTFSSLKEKICHQRTVKHCMPHVCMECPERFPTWETKQRHLVQVHGRSKKSYACSHCDVKYSDRRSFYDHYKKYHTKDCLICIHCGLKFSCTSRLNRHMGKHTS
nr:zinc finger protein 567-like isoform X17 [Danaus plexippus plexippus]